MLSMWPVVSVFLCFCSHSLNFKSERMQQTRKKELFQLRDQALPFKVQFLFMAPIQVLCCIFCTHNYRDTNRNSSHFHTILTKASLQPLLFFAQSFSLFGLSSLSSFPLCFVQTGWNPQPQSWLNLLSWVWRLHIPPSNVFFFPPLTGLMRVIAKSFPKNN